MDDTSEFNRLREIEQWAKELERTGWLDGPIDDTAIGHIPPVCLGWNFSIIRKYCKKLKESLSGEAEKERIQRCLDIMSRTPKDELAAAITEVVKHILRGLEEVQKVCARLR